MNTLENGRGFGVVGKTDIFENDFLRKGREDFCARLVGLFFGLIEVSKDLDAGALGGLELLIDGANALEGRVGLEEREDESKESTQGHDTARSEERRVG